MSACDALLARLPRATLVVGKGGVGKTTCAAALALRASERANSLVLTTDPARALPTVLGEAVGPVPAPLSYAPRLSARFLDAGPLRTAFIERWGGVLRTILDRGTYLDDSDIGPLVETALPGGDEIFPALELARLFAESIHPSPPPAAMATGTRPSAENRLFIDTAPTGHTLRLLQLPQTFRALVRLLDAMQNKHRFMVRTLTRAYRADAADAFIAEMGRLVSALEETLRDPTRCAAVLVTNDQPIVLDETRRYLAALRGLGIEVAAVVWNAVDAVVPSKILDVAEQYVVPRLDGWPTGEQGLRGWCEALSPVARQRAPKNPRSEQQTKRVTPPMPADRSRLLSALTIVAGKGGVGKTTVACVLALAASERHRTLLVSTDPAPSLADAFQQPIPDADTPIAGAPQLLARQMDASAAFDRLRTEYAAKVDTLFEGLVGRGVDMGPDRAIARDLLALAPAGVDEVYALTLLADALLGESYQRVVVDPAPTGHLLRLLEMPELALAWCHQLMRLMLKYKDVTGLGDTAQELLVFSRRLRLLETLLHDHSRSTVVLVTLDEPVVQAETARLAAEVRARGVAVSAVITNRSNWRGALPVPDVPVHFEAPAVDPPPVGVDALRDWAETWIAAHDS